MGNQPWPQFQNGIRERPIGISQFQGQEIPTIQAQSSCPIQIQEEQTDSRPFFSGFFS